MNSDPASSPAPAAAPAYSPETQADIAAWTRRQAEKASKRAARHAAEGIDGNDLLKILRENLPEKAPPLPYEYTDEGKRMVRFRQLCPAEFMQKVDRSRLKNPEAYDRAAAWDGSFRGPLLEGVTETRKSGAAWSAMGRLFVKGGQEFAWWPVKKLIADIEEYEAANMAEAFWRKYQRFPVLMVDDADKINWSYESQKSALWAFYDWIYRDHRPCITTTNKGRKWWTDRMGEAFARRLFEGAHHHIAF